MYRTKCLCCGEWFFANISETKDYNCLYCESCIPKRPDVLPNGVIESDVGAFSVILKRNELATNINQSRKSNKNYKRVFYRDNGICQYCYESGDTIDHIVPVTAGGGNGMENLVCCCRRCNNIASNLLFKTFEDKLRYILKKTYSKHSI